MSVFSKLKTAVADATSAVVGGTINSAKENSKLVGIRAELATLESDLNASYSLIGRKFVDFLIAASAEKLAGMPDIGVGTVLSQIEPKLEKKAALEDELVKIERELGDANLLHEKSLFEKEFQAEKEKLDKARKLGVLSEAEYGVKLGKFQRRLDNFEEFRKVDKQLELGVISKEEHAAKMAELTK
ncbi:MAG: hypothetical protein RLZZ244_1822 [Verrucomicrobiota bacterium]|jgi:hypothetical protein